MAFIPVAETVKASIIYQVSDTEVVNTLYFRKNAGSVIFADLSSISSQLSLWLNNEFMPLFPDVCRASRIETRDLTFEESFARVDSIAIDGGLIQAVLPLNVTKRIMFGTSLAGRTTRGSNYIPCAGESQVSGNEFSTTLLPDVVAAYQQLLVGGAYGAPDFDWVMVSRYKDNNPRAFGVPRIINQVYYQGDDVDSQKRRIPS